jgi:hypothetical protein
MGLLLALLLLAQPAHADLIGTTHREHRAGFAAVWRPGVPRPPAATIHRTGCPGMESYRPCAYGPTREAWVPRGSGRFARWHELGRLDDFQVLTDADRARFAALLEIAGPWDQGTGQDCDTRACPSATVSSARSVNMTPASPSIFARRLRCLGSTVSASAAGTGETVSCSRAM